MRYEHTIQNVKYLLGKGDNFKKDFDDVVPSASIGWKLTDMSNLRLGYNMRIYRPGIWYLNPYLNDSNPTNITQGNPNLDSEKSPCLQSELQQFYAEVQCQPIAPLFVYQQQHRANLRNGSRYRD